MNILYYNWAPINTDKIIGGGVTVYLKNLISYFQTQINNQEVNITYLSSGYYYDKSTKKTYIKKGPTNLGFNVYTIVNSPILAPHGLTKDMYITMCHDKEIVEIFNAFIKETGPYDIIHFNSLEGISPQVLSLKLKYPQTKFIHTIHDYGIFCPNVKFWTKNNTNCVKDNNRPTCSDCRKLVESIPSSLIKLRRSAIKKEKILFYRLLTKTMSILRLYNPSRQFKDIYEQYRALCIQNINNYVDIEFVVSQRVGEIAEKYGINKNKIKIAYIGSKVAEHIHPPKSKTDGFFTLLYMGYMSEAKGFNLYISALDKLNDQLSSQIDLKFASKITNKKLYEKALKLNKKFHKVTFYNGYTHSDFPMIMKNVTLGVVPPQWEDNLPQVTLEMIANGIPVLTSNNGGAHELNNHSMFTFRGENDLINKIETIFNNKFLLEDYWKYSIPLTTMQQHVEQLIRIYNGGF